MIQRRFKISVEGQEYDVSVVEVSDEAQRLYPEPLLGTTEPATAEPEPAKKAAAPKSKRAAAKADAGPGDVTCPIAGVVVSVDVAVGAAVKKDTKVVTLEAMKTKTIVNAGRDGKVKSIAIAAGDAVEPGQTLLTIA